MRRLLFVLSLLSPVALAAVPPSAPVIVEPEADDRSYHAADVHMATAPFADADGDGHRCSDWEIVEQQEVAWSAPCVTGSSRIHIHLGDGTFTRGRSGLNDGTAYVLRVRHRDDSGDDASEWSVWSERRFHTAPGSAMPPLAARDLLGDPAPRWTTTAGQPVALPPGARLSLQAADGERLLDLFEDQGATAVDDGPAFAARAAVRAVLSAGNSAWTVPESEVSLYDDEGVEHTIYLPATVLPPSVTLHLWVSANGSVHESKPEDRAPDFASIVRGAPVPWTPTQKGYVVEQVAGGLQLPVNIAFVPRPREEPDSPFFYVTELYGTIKVVTRGGQVRDYATGLIDFFPGGGFPGEGETGLAGIAVEPQSGDVLVAALYWRDGWMFPRIVRLSSDDGGLSAARATTVLDMPYEQQAPSHQISNVSIGPDGKVYFHMGDAHYAPYAQDLRTMRGKIVRMNLDGSAPEDNPFYDAKDGITATDYIFALGFRNPFGGAWRAADGMLYEVENGPTTDRFARVHAGFNYGWDGTNDSMSLGAVCTFPKGTAPVNVAFVQQETFGGSGFPEEKLDRAFITASGPTWASGTPPEGKRILEVAVKLDGTLKSGPATLLTYDGTGKATVAGIAAGPDGLYFTSLYRDFGYETPTDRGASVFRVRWTGYAAFVMSPDVRGPLHVALTDRSVVADADSWRWDFGDGTSSAERNVVHRFPRAGSYLVTLTVTRGGETFVARKKIHLAGGGAGLRAEYFPSSDLSGAGVRRIERKIEWDADPVLPVTAEQFSVRWSGRLLPRVSEPHRFVAEGSGDVRIWIDGELATGEVALEAGQMVEIVVEYVHRGGPPRMRLSWESDTQPLAVVPPSVLFAPEGMRRRASRS
ncbi:MAG TPA: PQQ-dependent sugar dehydrogenase [Thermoanaerobaculia bacterium]